MTGLLLAVAVLSLAMVVLGLAFAALAALSDAIRDRRVTHRKGLRVQRGPDPRVHRTGSVIEYDFHNRRRRA